MADELNTDGRKANAAQPLGKAPDTDSNDKGAERYPKVRQDDSVEGRSFDPAADAPNPPRGAGDTSAPKSATDGRMGPGADPAEGKR